MRKNYEKEQMVQATGVDIPLTAVFQANNSVNFEYGFFLRLNNKYDDEVYGVLDLESARKLSQTMSEWVADADLNATVAKPTLDDFSDAELTAELAKRWEEK